MIRTLKNVINPSLLVKFIDNRRAYQIKESQSSAKLSKINIYGVDPNSSLCFRTDTPNIPAAIPYLNAKHEKINKRADGVLIVERDNQIIIIIIEMKSKYLGEYELQFKNTRAVIEFIRDFLTMHNIIDSNRYQIIFKCILFSLRPHRSGSRPQKAKPMNVDILEFPCNGDAQSIHINQLID